MGRRGMRRSVLAGALVVLLVPGVAACSDDGGDDAASEEDGEPAGDVELPVPPIEEAPESDPCDLFTGLVGTDAIAEAMGSDVDSIEPAEWAGADTSWTASCVASGAGRDGSTSATVTLTLSTAALPAGTEEVDGLEGGFLDPDLSVVTWSHEGLDISIRVNTLPRDDDTASADDEAATTLAEQLQENL